MFKLDMQAIRCSADAARLTANLANPANSAPEASLQPPRLATLAGLAISHDSGKDASELLTAQVVAAAMRACDHHDDGEEARAQMRADIEATPPDLRADLLDHFTRSYALRSAA